MYIDYTPKLNQEIQSFLYQNTDLVGFHDISTFVGLISKSVFISGYKQLIIPI